MRDSHDCPRPSTPPCLLAAAATGVLDSISRVGGDPGLVFGVAGLPVEAVGDPMNELPLHQYCTLFDEAARQTGIDTFGLRFGYHFKPKSLGALGHVAINSPTLGAALANMCRYFAACQGASMLRLGRDSALMRLAYQIRDGRIVNRRQDAELSIGMFLNVFWHCLGPGWHPAEIHFEHARPCDAGEHQRLFGAPVYFSQATNAILFDQAVLAAPMPEPDAFVLTVMEAVLAGRHLRAAPSDFEADIRQAVADRLAGGVPRLDEVAGTLRLSRAQLLRRLSDHGMEFTDLVRAARRERALTFIVQPHFQLTEISMMLGYSELSAFSRAFRQWTGISPLRYRRARLGEQDGLPVS